MESVRLPRFKRSAEVAPVRLTERDRQIIRLIHRHRFLRSDHVVTLLSGSRQQILRRLQLLYHHGFLERPRCQIDYYHRNGSRSIVYGLGNKGAGILARKRAVSFHDLDWSGKNRAVGQLFLEHALLVSDVMVALELACRESGRIRLLGEDELSPSNQSGHPRELFQWSVNVNSRLKLGLIPDRVFALEVADNPADRAYFFLEADRGTMPITRRNLFKSSFQRKLLAYEATWTQNVHRTRFGFHRFRVLTVATSAERSRHLTETAAGLERGRGLFLFTDAKTLLIQSPLAAIWKSPSSNQSTSLLD